MKRRVRFVSLIVVLASALACSFFYSGCGSKRSRREAEAILRLDLQTMRQAIDQYTLDKQKPPQSLQDLMDGHYLKEIPTDPFTLKKDWVPQFDDVVMSQEQSSTGMVDVHSASSQADSNGIPYNHW